MSIRGRSEQIDNGGTLVCVSVGMEVEVNVSLDVGVSLGVSEGVGVSDEVGVSEGELVKVGVSV